MSELEVNDVNASQSEVVDTQPNEPSNVDVTSVNGDVADTETQPKQVQTPEENAKFAEYRRKAEADAQKAIDAEYERLFGTEYGIKTKAEYDQKVAEYEEEQRRQEYIDKGIDPDDIKSLYEEFKKNDPDFQELSKARKEASVNKAISDFVSEFPDAGVKSFDDLDKLPNIDKITEYVGRGMTLNEAYKLANYDSIMSGKATATQNETIAKITANREATPGSLSDTGKTAQLYTREQVDAMSQNEIYKNYDLVMKSMKTWR